MAEGGSAHAWRGIRVEAELAAVPVLECGRQRGKSGKDINCPDCVEWIEEVLRFAVAHGIRLAADANFHARCGFTDIAKKVEKGEVDV